MNQHLRYTGPELAALLDQVRTELGAQATIVEANKIRSGGIAGFFASEQFEVVAAPPESLVEEAERVNHEPVAPSALLETRVSEQTTADRLSSSLLDRADAISLQERIELSRPRRPDPERAPVPEPVPVPERADLSFNEILSARLQSSTETYSDPDTGFWDRLQAFERPIVLRDPTSPIVTIVGTRSSALSVARHLETDDGRSPRALVVLTNAEVGPDLMPWQVVRTDEELDERLELWAKAARPGIVVIDADLGAQATRLVERTRQAGSKLLRLAVDAELPAERLSSLLEDFGGQAVVDLTYNADPSHVLDLVGRGVPIASVGGRLADAGFMLAMSNSRRDG